MLAGVSAVPLWFGHHNGASAEGLSEASEQAWKVVSEGGEEAMTDRILEWCVYHDTPELRNERGIAAMLEMGLDDVRLDLSILKTEGRANYQWIDGKQAWFALVRRGL